MQLRTGNWRRRSILTFPLRAVRAVYETVTIRHEVSRNRRRERARPVNPADFSEAGFAPTPHVPENSIDFSTSNLTEIADHFRTDKGSIRHLYTPTYESYLAPMRGRPGLAILEIGVASGASLRMWNAYFPTAKVVGLDVDQACRDVCSGVPGIEIRIADATRSRQPERFDIVVDDGTHLAGQMVEAYRTHWPSVKPGGFYMIEDLACTHDRQYGIAALAVYRLPVTRSRMAMRSTFARWLEDELRALDLGESDWEFCHFYRELCIIKRREPSAS